MAKVIAVNISTEKGVRKHTIPSCRLVMDHGIEGDAHAGNWHRQISLLAQESIDKMQATLTDIQLKPGDFAENITTAGIAVMKLPIGTKLRVGTEAELEVTQIGKECHGKRYNPATLEVHYKTQDIADVLSMTVSEAIKFFANIPNIYQKLKTLDDVGLGYLQLGQSATTLSGGEAQRVKLATELSRRSTGKTLYILDEPTTGLHIDDIQRLLRVLNKLVEKGNTVLIIEHQLDVIKSADWIIDLGPEGGDKGGYIVAEGTPKEVAKVAKSYTGQYLKKVMG